MEHFNWLLNGETDFTQMYVKLSKRSHESGMEERLDSVQGKGKEFENFLPKNE